MFVVVGGGGAVRLSVKLTAGCQALGLCLEAVVVAATAAVDELLALTGLDVIVVAREEPTTHAFDSRKAADLIPIQILLFVLVSIRGIPEGDARRLIGHGGRLRRVVVAVRGADVSDVVGQSACSFRFQLSRTRQEDDLGGNLSRLMHQQERDGLNKVVGDPRLSLSLPNLLQHICHDVSNQLSVCGCRVDTDVQAWGRAERVKRLLRLDTG